MFSVLTEKVSSIFSNFEFKSAEVFNLDKFKILEIY